MANLIKISGGSNANIQGKALFNAAATYTLGSSVASVNEGSSVTFTLSTTNVTNGTLVPYIITGISSGDLSSGSLAGNFTVASGLASTSVTLANDALTEGAETLTLTLSSGVATASVVVNDTSKTPLYALTSSAASVDEGSSVTFTLSTAHVANGTVLPYTISGISAGDLSSGSLTGSFTVSNGSANTSVTLANDVLTEGTETATLALNNGAASIAVTVNDTSKTPTYDIGRSLSAVNEGSSVTFTLSTTDVANGTVLPYTITGISANDVTTGSLTGTFTVNSGLATTTITMSADQLTEGAETATLTLNNAAASNFVVVNDTSVFTPTLISGLQLWLDASDTNTLYNATVGGSLVTTDGSAVARWNDKSGNNRHATQGTANERPLLKTNIQNGRSVLRLDGTNDKLFCAPQTVRTVFVVGSWRASLPTPKNYPILVYGNNLSLGTFIDGGTLNANGNNKFSTAGFILNTPTLVYNTSVVPSNPQVTNRFFRATNELEATQTGVTNTLIGHRDPSNSAWNGDIAELIIYSTALSASEIALMQTYLSTKWGI